VELQENLEKIRKRGLGVASVSYDSVAVLKHFADRRGIAYPLLADPDSKTIRAFGLLNDTVKQGTPQYGVPYPGTFIIDKSGVVTAKYFETDYRERYTASEILVRQYGEAAGGAGQAVETKHLRLTSSASLGTVHWGQRLALVLEFDLKPGMHVYAPGVQGYIPIELKLRASPAFQAHAPSYPPARKLRLKAIGETVPVYTGRFRVVADITIAPEGQVKPLLSATSELAVEGTLRYQACDARVCYPPETVPLKWVFRYESPDRQRVPADLQRKAGGR
jgi:hypothetical protein